MCRRGGEEDPAHGPIVEAALERDLADLIERHARREVVEVEPICGGRVGEKALIERSILRSDVEPLLGVVQFGNERVLAERIHRLVGDEELRDEIAARQIDGVSDRGERSARAEEDSLAPDPPA
jgi:hypothetical protein